MREGNVDLSLTVIDTPGFGDDVDNTSSWDNILRTVEMKLQDYLNAESRVLRRCEVPDTRVHCCLYFLTPNSHGLKPLDVEFMKRLHKRVNVVPIIAKADSLTSEECAMLKAQILRQIAENSISVYLFPPLTASGVHRNSDYVSRIPFAVVGSTVLLKSANGKVIRGREYPWGVVDADSLEHCDFVALRNLLIRSHMHDLIEVTHYDHYERFRSSTLAQATGGDTGDVTMAQPGRGGVGMPGDGGAGAGQSPLEVMEAERSEREAKLNTMELEMEQVFAIKVEEKRSRLVNTDAEFQRKYDLSLQHLERVRKETEEKKKVLEQQRKEWAAQHAAPTGKKEKKKK